MYVYTHTYTYTYIYNQTIRCKYFLCKSILVNNLLKCCYEIFSMRFFLHFVACLEPWLNMFSGVTAALEEWVLWLECGYGSM